MFYENYVRLCNSIGKTPSAVALEMGIAKPTVTRWKNGSNPNSSTLYKVADYFGVTPDYLLGSDENKKSSTPEGAELIPGYSKLSDANRAIVDSMIAQLLAAQPKD